MKSIKILNFYPVNSLILDKSEYLVINICLKNSLLINNIVKNEKIIIELSFHLNNGIKNINIISIYENYEKQYDKKEVLSRYFIPYIYKDKFDEKAEEFLKEYYPEALYKPIHIPVKQIALKMNLNIMYSEMSKNIKGQIYLKRVIKRIKYEGKTRLKIIKKGTILIN